MLTLALLVALANAGQPRVEYTGGRCEVRAGDRCFTSPPQSPVPSKAFEQLFPSPFAWHVPACADGSEGPCVFCAIGALDGSTTQFQCVKEDGGSAGTVVDPGGPTYPGPIPGLYAREIDGTNFPKLYNDGGLLDTFSRDGGTIMIAGYSRGGPSGYDYLLTDNNSTGCFLLRNDHGIMTYQWGALTQPIDGNNTLTEVNRNGWGTFTMRYTAGVDAGAGPAGTYLMNAGGDITRFEKVLVGTPGIDCASPWNFGARDTGDLNQSGPALFYWFAPGARSDDWVANHTQAVYGMPNNTGWLDRFISGLSYNTGADNTATTGNIDVMQAGTWVVDQAGVHGISGSATNYVGADPTDLSSNTKIGGATVITNVSRGPLANFKNGAECDRIVCPSAGAAVLTRDAGISGFTNWWDLTAYPKASDAGTANQLRLWIRSDGTFPDGGHEFDCDYSDLAYTTWPRHECRAPISGSPTYAIGGAACLAAGTFEICHWQFTNTTSAQPPTIDGNIRSSGDQTYATLPASFGQADAGPMGVELLWTAINDANTEWTTANDVQYPLDLEQGPTYGLGDHANVFAFGYTSPGLDLLTHRDGTTLCGGGTCDFHVSGRTYKRGHTYADRFESFPVSVGSNKCTSQWRERDCGAMDAGLSAQQLSDFLLSCTANGAPVIATDTNPDAGCTAPPLYEVINGRNGGSIVNDNNVNALRALQLK